jgi:4-hydroxybenzoate polyprenyltransferase
LSATLYNLKLKETLVSVLPYIISFGAVPWAIYLSAGKHPSLWLVLSFIIFSSAFHFLNVVKDLEMDLKLGVLGLPQRMGRRKSLRTAFVLIFVGLALVATKWASLF